MSEITRALLSCLTGFNAGEALIPRAGLLCSLVLTSFVHNVQASTIEAINHTHTGPSTISVLMVAQALMRLVLTKGEAEVVVTSRHRAGNLE